MIDARGRSCPEPVIMIRNAMASGETEYRMLVSSRSALENVTRFVKNKGYQVESELDGGDYKLHIFK